MKNSCVIGLGEPSYFYIESVFLLNGLNMGLFFLFGVYLRSVSTDVFHCWDLVLIF